MKYTDTNFPGFTDTKPHYKILDGLRGVAAIMVVCFHLFEAFATSHVDQRINHGYLAVDFFFLLSGFVIGYAYDDRWKSMSTLDFLKRRFVRLHPMVVIGAVIGALMFYFQGCEVWDVTKISVTQLLIATLLNVCLIPAATTIEIRGVGEMYPLNGPSWSLFFEYIGNILYALIIRRLSTGGLWGLVILSGLGLGCFAIFGPYGDICAGFTLTTTDFTAGFLRLLFSFSAGLLMSRIFKPTAFKGAFWWCSVAIVAILGIPRIGGVDHFWMNGVFDIVCCAVVFPLIVYVGASGTLSGKFTSRLCGFLGDISYPLYMVHYPFIYYYYAWVKNNNLSFEESFPGAALLLVGSIVLAYVCLKVYDIPLRKYLSHSLLRGHSIARNTKE